MSLLWLISFFLMMSTVAAQEPNPRLPPYGCANYGACEPGHIRTRGSSPQYFYCDSPVNCLCNDGTSGSNCTTAIDTCSSNPCPSIGHFECIPFINNYNCICQEGSTGTDCTMLDPSPCSSSPCENEGICTEVTNETYSCECINNRTGDRCQYNDKCVLQPGTCLNGGTCRMVFGGDNFFCDCPARLQGRYCGQKDNYPMFADIGCYQSYDSITSRLEKIRLNDEPSNTKCRNELDNARSEGSDFDTYGIMGSNCYLMKGNPFNLTKTEGCDQKCGGEWDFYDGKDELCGHFNKRTILLAGYSTWIDPKQCENKTCVEGLCIEGNGTASCICPRHRSGNGCSHLSTPCDSNPCGALNNCTDNLIDYSFKCTCQTANYTGKQCEQELFCSFEQCSYGGKCVELYNDYRCECLQYYTGKNCELPNYCLSNPCNNGNCTPVEQGLNSSYTCECSPGWTGARCLIDINECSPTPCENGGTCRQVRPPGEPFYTCDCISGTTGINCETNFDDCVYETIDHKLYSPCNKSDPNSRCVDGFNTFHCDCSPEFTGEFCDIDMVIYDVLMAIYGTVNADMLDMLKELLSNPAMIKDMVPFILGLKTYDERLDMSWDFSDLFDWFSYEEKKIDVTRDFQKWNDVVLGNCFTFNHLHATQVYQLRGIGVTGGLYGQMRVHGDEYFPWVDTEAISVFVHPPEDYIFSESVRHNAQPHAQTELVPELTEYSRLRGKYGVCVNDVKEVGAYYYPGTYSTNGCLRSCYQDAVYDSCECMDPRYPLRDGVPPCDLQKRNCVEQVSEERGDPSTWPKCNCPLPCSNKQFDVTWRRGTYRRGPEESDALSEVRMSNFSTRKEDTLLIQIIVTNPYIQLYEEVPAMDFNRFIGNLGGLLGVLCGISIITFIEFGFLIARLWMICISNK